MATQHNEMPAAQAGALDVQPPPLVQIRRALSSRPERVYDTFLDPAQIRPWLDRGVGEVTQLFLEPQVGGALVVAVRRPGQEPLDGHGTIRELERPRRIAFTWASPSAEFPESLVNIVIEPRPDGGSMLVLTHVLDASCADATEHVEATWLDILDGLAETLGYPACDDPSIDEP